MSLKNKAVLISIRPEWCDLIVRGKKTIEVRKTRPKLETPFKVYIYCTKAPQQLITIFKDGEETMDGEIHHGFGDRAAQDGDAVEHDVEKQGDAQRPVDLGDDR